MDDPRESKRLADKVDPRQWYERYLSSGFDQCTRFLDVGCGPGVLAHEIASRDEDREVIALDVSAERLRDAEKLLNRYPKSRLVQGNASEIPLPANYVDVVICRFLLQYVPDKSRVLAELCRVCKPGGTVVLQDLDGQLIWHYPLADSLSVLLDEVMAGLAKQGFDPLVGRKLFFLAKHAGLEQLSIRNEPYHLIAGAISPELRRLWELKLDIAMPAVSAAVGEPRARELRTQFMEHLLSEDTLTYSTMFTVYGVKPPTSGETAQFSAQSK